jgi:hypothetical protein
MVTNASAYIPLIQSIIRWHGAVYAIECASISQASLMSCNLQPSGRINEEKKPNYKSLWQKIG